MADVGEAMLWDSDRWWGGGKEFVLFSIGVDLHDGGGVRLQPN